MKRSFFMMTGVELKKLKGHTNTVNSVAFSSDGTQIVSGSVDNSVRVWDASTGVELKELKGHTSWVYSVAFSSDGTRIVSGSSDNSVRVWDVSTGVELKELKGHTHRVNSVAFSSDGTRIVSGSSDNSVRVWDVPMIGCEHFVWNLADTNWIISSQGQDHLMWMPQEANLVHGFNILIISRSGFATVDFDQSMIGVDWVRCYTP
jgi:WD40 repeat protein